MATAFVERTVVRIWGSTDLDDIFAYKTTREVKIRDRRLGIASYLTSVGVILYVILQLLYQGEYLAESPVEGTARLSLTPPQSTCTGRQRRGHDPPPPGGCKQCDPMDVGCYDLFANVSFINYCTQSLNATAVKERLPCRYEEAASSGKVFQSSLLISTTARELRQVKVCSAKPDDPLYQGGECDQVYNTTSEDLFYYADIESFWVLLSHAVRTQEKDTLISSNSLDGMLRLNHDDLCMEAFRLGLHPVDGYVTQNVVDTAPCFLTPNITADGRDYFSVQALLAAAGIRLDDDHGSGVSVRRNGTTLLVSVTYSNWRSWQLIGPSGANPRYEYRVTPLDSGSFVFAEAIYDSYPVHRTLLERYGVRIVVLQTGQLHRFDMLSALITVTTALTLITVSTFLVDTVATTCMPGASLYQDYKTLVTPDMSDVRDGVRCATCNEVLTEIFIEEEDGDGHCGVCDQDVSPGGTVWRCTNCPRGPVDRCKDCLVASTINQPAKLNLSALVLAAFDTNHDGELCFEEFEHLRSTFVSAHVRAGGRVHLPEAPPAEEWDADPRRHLRDWLRALQQPEREWLRRHLRPNQVGIGGSKFTPAVAFLRATMRIGSSHDILRLRRDPSSLKLTASLRSLRASQRMSPRTAGTPSLVAAVAAVKERRPSRADGAGPAVGSAGGASEVLSPLLAVDGAVNADEEGAFTGRTSIRNDSHISTPYGELGGASPGGSPARLAGAYREAPEAK